MNLFMKKEASVCVALMMFMCSVPAAYAAKAEDRNVLKLAEKSVASFATKAECKYVQGILRPQLPDVSADLGASIAKLSEARSLTAMANIAAVLVRFARENEMKGGTGSPMDGQHVLVKSFAACMKPELPGDEIVSSSLAQWICKHRGLMGRSPALDREIIAYRKWAKKQAAKYKDLTKIEERVKESLKTKRD